MAGKQAKRAVSVEIESEDDDYEVSGDELDQDVYEDEVESQMDVDDSTYSRAPSEAVSASAPSGNATPAPSTYRPSPLKVTLKLGGRSKMASTAGSGTPDRDVAGPSRRRVDDIESEEEDELDDMSVVSSSRLTARQAALASGFEAEHVELKAAPSRKKKNFNEAELAARRSETALRRRHQTEKKLEDDKTETINRLLKKQSVRTRNKKALEETQMAAAAQSSNSSTAGGPPNGNYTDRPPTKPAPPSYRWISTTRKPATIEGDDAGVPRVTFSLSIPVEFLAASTAG